jgi:hypothetical protein
MPKPFRGSRSYFFWFLIFPSIIYAQTVATPTFNPAAGTYSTTQSVTLSTTTGGATIRYTTDGSTPTSSSTVYSTQITVSATTTLKAYASASGMTDSSVASATYTIVPVLNGYGYYRTITINSGQVSGTLPNFPLLISGQYSYLATAQNGGYVTSVKGYDIIFTSDPQGLTKLPFEQESYSPTTGTINYWVQMPTTFTSNTVIYMFYGNSSVTTDQSNTAGTWDSNYAGVYHFGDGTTLSANGSTSNPVNGTIRGAMATTGKISGAGSYNATTRTYIDYGAGTALNTALNGSFTLSAWINPTNTSQGVFFGNSDGNQAREIGMVSGCGTGIEIVEAEEACVFSSGSNLTIGVWHYVVWTYDTSSNTNTLYLDGSSVGTASFNFANVPFAGHYYTSNGAGTNAQGFNGGIDETRVSSAVRSASWIIAEYNNQNSPGSFYGVGPQQTSGIVVTPTFNPTAGMYATTQSVTLSTTTGGATIYYTTDGSTPTSSSTVYSSPITVSATTTLKTYASASGMTDSSVASATYTIAPAVATPTFSPAAGTYTSVQSVTIASTTSGATIYYTTDGSSPTTSSTLYSTSITVSTNTTVNAIGVKAGMTNSAVGTAAYAIVVATPTFSPPAGTYSAAQSVTITSATPFAAIHYTTDGSTPSAYSNQYTAPITVSANMTINAIAKKTGMTNSAVGTAAYAIGVSTPTFTPLAGTYSVPQIVMLTSATSGATIYYTTDGSTPTTSSALYSAAITVSTSMTINAIAVKTGMTNSAVGTAVYSIAVSTPTFAPAAGTYSAPQSVTITSATSGAAIYYTTDGTTPTTSSTQYSTAISVNANETINAIAVKAGMTTSAVGTAAYSIAVPTPTFTPTAGTYPGPQTVTISSAPFGTASIRYTTDGTTPTTTSGSTYSGPIPIGSTLTVKAIAYATGCTTSAVATAVFTITPPAITTTSPTSGGAGTQVTVSGSNFGSTQGTGAVWLGTTLGTVVSWSNTQIVATVAPGSTTGVAQVQQGGGWSNSVQFTVNTATISGVTPVSGLPGTQVTIAGSGFGANQGNGQVWLGTTNGVVQSWSDTQIVATVSTGSATGKAQVLQNGVWSNTKPFSVNSLQITSISPASGAPGTSVTITGAGFGAAQGTGTVQLGSINGVVISWSDTQVMASVATGSLTGIASIQQNGVTSNAKAFTVPSSGGTAVTLVPNVLNMAVGDTHTIQALGSTGQSVTGLTWTSSNPSIVSLSTTDPPILTALAVGHVTITAGTASADVTVSATLPLGTVLWSNPGDGSGVTKIIPAVPSATGVADVFALQNDNTIAAITSDGTTAWTYSATPADFLTVVPDFQGGLIVYDSGSGGASIKKLDGITGQPYPAYSGTNLGLPVVHTDGTIFAVQGTSVIGIDPTTGSQKFSVPISIPGPAMNPNNCPANGGTTYSTYAFDIQTSSGSGYATNLMVAGDGNAYLAFGYNEFVLNCRLSATHLRLLQVSSSGSSNVLTILDTPPYDGHGNATLICETTNFTLGMITNADTGLALSWSLWFEAGEGCTPGPLYGMATTTGSSVSVVPGPSLPGQTTFGGPELTVVPVLQAQDGSFVGTVSVPGPPPTYSQTNMVAFDATGNVRWVVANETPQIATADGGVLGQSGTTYDQNGNATGQVSIATQSWSGLEYTSANSISQVFLPPIPPDIASFWSQAGGNPSGSGTAGTVCACLVQGGAPAGAPDVAPIVRRASETGRPADIPKTPAGANFLILEGDPGINTIECPSNRAHCHDTGMSWPAVGSTQMTSLSQQGYSAVQARISSVQDFETQLTRNGTLAGGVIYIGHGGSVGEQGVWDGALFAGQGSGASTNITRGNVASLSNANLSSTATVTLYTCEGAYGGYYWSIASQLAMQLRRHVFAWNVSMFLSKNPNATTPNGFPLATPPLYLLPYGGAAMKCYSPSGYPETCPAAQPPFHPYFPN